MTNGRSPGRPREEHIDEDILRAAVAELSFNGFQNFSVAGVARRANVAKATVYLRWPKREQLIFDSLQRTGESLVKPKTGTLRGDLEVLVRQWSDIYNDPERLRLYGRLMAEEHAFGDMIENYRQVSAGPVNKMVEVVIREARRRGEVRPEASSRAASRSLVGALMVEAIFTKCAIKPSFERNLVDMLYAGLAAET